MSTFYMTTFARRRCAMLLLFGVSVAALSACEFDRVSVPTGTSRPVLHAVLDPFIGNRTDFTVLVERTLGGRVRTSESHFDRLDPIVTGGGEPFTNARVVIRNPANGDSAVGIAAEARRDGEGRGVYIFENSGCSALYCPSNGIVLTRGQRYTIELTSPTGDHVTGETTIPEAFARPDTGSRTILDRDRDRYVFRWKAAPTDFRRYAVQVQTPYGAFQTFSTVESLAINGTLRNFQQARIPHVFVPGFLQPMLAFAVDSNYFDYYRSENDFFTGQGLVNRLQGGTGLFGSIHQIRYQELDVVAAFDEPLDGVWTLIGDASGFPPRLSTWADGSFASGNLRWVFDPEFITRRGILGSRSGNTLRLAVLGGTSYLGGQDPRDTAWTMVGEVRNDTLYTTSPEKGEQRWRRVLP